MKLFAVDHQLGVSLVRATTEEKALAKAKRLLGENAGPYRCREDQEQQIAWAQAMGAGEL